ncbi:MAG: TMEM175 family protein [Luteimonas sp.]
MNGAKPRDGTSRNRGREVTRIEAFVDAAFAFAVTLLVISFNALPDNAGALIDALKGVPAFAASFSLLAMLWWSHADWSRRYGLDDGRSVVLSLLLVFLVLVYVFPLRIIFSMLFWWISGGWLPSSVTISSTRDLQVMFTAYGVAWTTLGCVTVALYRHAWKMRDTLALDHDERIALRGAIAAQAMIPATGLISLSWLGVTELLGKPSLAAMSGFAYALMSLTGVAVSRARRRAGRELDTGA